MVTTGVIAVFENTPAELLELFENFCDPFCGAALHSEVQFPCSASSNSFARRTQHWFEDSIVNAKYGGCTEAVCRPLGQGPTSVQPYRSSLYLEVSLFSYDDKWCQSWSSPGLVEIAISVLYPGPWSAQPQAYAGSLGLPINHVVRCLTASTFHSCEPFAISVQRTNAEYVVNSCRRHRCM
ncbi:hypothetical protein HJG60_012064 [Phyllostomus discolor]|uniref:Uncharacterized protein n=1 Tax=Phyllostomus discolor TaxID=89673 RepID=A0A834DYQ2_9CHIR|nr:hypothetical protein HJG60_012064 [Phyllostomus discolor]